MDKLVPLISSTVVGPLGVAHLPRLWLKALLAETDALYDGWVPDYRGFNKTVLDALEVDADAFFAFMKTLPTYPQTERWVREHARKLDGATVAALNAKILAHERPEERAAETRAQVGLEGAERRAAALNDLDDWHTVHAWLVAHRDEKLPLMIPTVSSASAGPLGAKHLPRMWMKALLDAVGALPEDYNSGPGFDGLCGRTLNLDVDAAIAYVRAELPGYLAFEAYVREHVPAVDEATLEAYNRVMVEREKPEEKAAAERAEAGVPELAFREVIMLNDMVDWKALHDWAGARRSAPA